MTLAALVLPTLIQTFQFQPTVTEWLCPKGARSILLECKPTESKMAPVTVSLDAVGNENDFFQGGWESQTPDGRIFESVLVTSFVHETEGPVLLISANAGFDPDSAKQSGVFMDVAQSGVPKQLMITGDRQPLNETQEIVITLELNEISAR